MKTIQLREIAENLYKSLYGKMVTRVLEKHDLDAIEVCLKTVSEKARNETVNEAVSILDGWIQGTLETVNSGDKTLKEIYPELKRLEKIQKEIENLAK